MTIHFNNQVANLNGSGVVMDSPTPYVHKKMFKKGKMWMAASLIAGATIAGSVITNSTAHADTTDSGTTATAATTDGGGSTSATTQITVPSSNVTSAYDNAVANGATAGGQTAGQTYNTTNSSEASSAVSAVTENYANQTDNLNSVASQAAESNADKSTLDEANSSVQSAVAAASAADLTTTPTDATTVSSHNEVANATTDAQNQVSTIQQAVTQHQNAVATVSAANEYNSQLASEAEQANKIAGLNVTSNGEVTVNSPEEAKAAMAEQLKKIQDAEAAQKFKNKSAGITDNTISSSQVSQQLILGNEANATTQITYLADGIAAYVAGNDNYGVINGSYGHRKLVGDITTADQAGYGYVFVDNASNPLANPINGEIAQVTYTNLSNSYYGDTKISKIVVTYSNATPTGNMYKLPSENGGQGYFLSVSQNPVSGNMRSVDIQSTYQYYDENGNIIDFGKDGGAWLSVGSLNFDQGKNTSTGDESGTDANQGISEAISVVSGGEGHALYNSSIQNHDGTYYANFNNYASNFDPSSPYYGWDSTGSKLQYYGAMVVKLTGTSVTLQEKLQAWGGASISDAQYQNKYLRNAWFTASTDIPKTPDEQVTYSTIKSVASNPTEVSYHLYNDAIKTPTASYSLDTINYTPASSKTVDAVVDGQATSINGNQTVVGGAYYYTISSENLPANRDRVKDGINISDTLPDGEIIKSVHVYASRADAQKAMANNNSNGNIDSQFNITHTDQDYSVTPTASSDYTVDKLNANPSSVFTLPVVVIEFNETKESSSYDNTATYTINGVKRTTPTVKTTTGKTEAKKTETLDGRDVDGEIVMRDTNLTYGGYLDLTAVTSTTSISDSDYAKGIYDYDDYADEYVTLDDASFKLIDTKGNNITDAAKKAGLTVTDQDGVLTIAAPTDKAALKAFIATYGGQKLNWSINYKINDDVADDTIIPNTYTQYTFGNQTASNTVTSTVKSPSLSKDVKATADSMDSLNNSEIQVGETFVYPLAVSSPEGMQTPIKTAYVVDDYDQDHDQYNGKYTISNVNITLKDGTTITSGDELTKYITSKDENGVLTFTLDPEFASQIDQTKGYTFTINPQFTRIAAGDVYNTFSYVVNGVVTQSNTVVTHTPEPASPTPETPATPQETSYTPSTSVATPETPTTPAQALPQTGNEDGTASWFLGILALLGSISLFGLSKRKKEEA